MPLTNVEGRSRDSPVFTTKYADPHYNKQVSRGRERRGIGDLIYLAKERHRSPEIVPASQLRIDSTPDCPQHALKPSSATQAQAQEMMKRMINGDYCRSADADGTLSWKLKTQADNLLLSNDYKLFRHDRRTLSVFFEPFFVGATLDTARLVVIASCTSPEDRQRVENLIKKSPQVPGFKHIGLLAMEGSPRSSVPLIKLASGQTLSSLAGQHARLQ